MRAPGRWWVRIHGSSEVPSGRAHPMNDSIGASGYRDSRVGRTGPITRGHPRSTATGTPRSSASARFNSANHSRIRPMYCFTSRSAAMRHHNALPPERRMRQVHRQPPQDRPLRTGPTAGDRSRSQGRRVNSRADSTDVRSAVSKEEPTASWAVLP